MIRIQPAIIAGSTDAALRPAQSMNSVGHADGIARCLLQQQSRSVVAPIRPSAPRLAKRNARIDVTIEASPGRGRHTLTIRCVRAVAGNADTPALDTIGIIDRGRRTGAGYRGGTGRRLRFKRSLLTEVRAGPIRRAHRRP